MSACIRFDFAKRLDAEIGLDEIDPLADVFYWADLSGDDCRRRDELLAAFGTVAVDEVGEEAESATHRFNDLGSGIHFTLVNAWLQNRRIRTGNVDVYFSQQLMLTVHRGEAGFLDRVRSTCRSNFRKIARSPGFLLFELADHLTQEYTMLVHNVASSTEEIESNLFKDDADDGIFQDVAELIRSILEFYKVIVAAREVFHDLATRLSPCIPETTQPFLEKKAALLERLGVDVTTEREILSESLHLYMGIVTHRTNAVLTRLTLLSTFFLPLSFLVGLYGMNLKLPEVDWEYGYLWFWCLVLMVVGTLWVYLRKQKYL